MEKIKLAWAAGFFDGEGHISFCEQKHKGGKAGYGIQYHFNFQVGQANTKNLERLKEAIGFGKIYGPYSSGYNKIWHYRLDNFQDVQMAMCLLWNYLGPIKKEQYKKALRLVLEKRYGRSAATA